MTFLDQTFIWIANNLHVIAIAIAGIWFVSTPKQKWGNVITFGIVVLPLTLLVARIISALYFNARPFEVEGFTPLIPHKPDNGFPSDHTLLISALAAVVFPYSKKVSALLWFCAALVGGARVYVGVHHVIDILGSMFIATVVAMSAWRVLKNYLNKPNVA